MDAVNTRAVMGGNAPPLAERLTLAYADLVKRAKETAEMVPDQIRAIADDDEAEAYTETAAAIKKLIKEADDAFAPEKEPWLTGGKTVDDFFRFRAALKAKAEAVVRALNAFQTAKLAAQRKADAEAAESARKEAALFDEPAPVIAPTIVKEAARVVSFSGAKASGSIKWEFSVADLDKVPREYLTVNKPAIEAAIAGMKARGLAIADAKIEGLTIFEAVKTSIRR